jgi:hypothetical protein
LVVGDLGSIAVCRRRFRARWLGGVAGVGAASVSRRRSPRDPPQLLGDLGALPLLTFENVVEWFGHQLVEAGADRGHDVRLAERLGLHGVVVAHRP